MVNLISSSNIAFPKITLESTLKDLNLYCCQLEITGEGRFALQLLNAEPKLLGVILMDKEQLIGFISRQRLLEQMSRPYGLELFLKRPLFQLYQYTKIEHLILSEETPITFAAQQVINRSSNLLNEPIIVEKTTNNYALLDIHQLLIAHSNIFQLATSLLEENNHKLQRMAVIDPLTGIGNRRFFDQYFLRDWQLAIREKRWITVVMCDVDYFKKYNDTYGHQAGDHCLCQVAAVFQHHCKRATDLVARYGGEEFILSFLNTKVEQAIILIESIQKSLQALEIEHQNSPINSQVTLSFGIASMKPQSGQESHRLIELADKALYQAKEKGRNQFFILTHKKK
jgi:diguanylate cyclase (GGDEF)-like protein